MSNPRRKLECSLPQAFKRQSLFHSDGFKSGQRNMAMYKGGNALIFILKLRGPRSVIARRSLPLYHTSALLSIGNLYKKIPYLIPKFVLDGQ